MKIAAAIFATAVSVCWLPSAFGERVELIVGGETIVIDDARIERRDGTLVIEAETLHATTGASCDIKLTGAEHLTLSALSAKHVSIFMDGNSRLDVEQLTSDSLQTTAAGFSRVDIQGSE